MYDSTEQQGDEEVGQLTGGDVDTRNLKTIHKQRKRQQQAASGWEIRPAELIYAHAQSLFIQLRCNLSALHIWSHSLCLRLQGIKLTLPAAI